MMSLMLQYTLNDRFWGKQQAVFSRVTREGLEEKKLTGFPSVLTLSIWLFGYISRLSHQKSQITNRESKQCRTTKNTSIAVETAKYTTQRT